MWRPDEAPPAMEDFNAARKLLLTSLTEEYDLTLLEVLEAYNHIPEFKRRIDITSKTDAAKRKPLTN